MKVNWLIVFGLVELVVLVATIRGAIDGNAVDQIGYSIAVFALGSVTMALWQNWWAK